MRIILNQMMIMIKMEDMGTEELHLNYIQMKTATKIHKKRMNQEVYQDLT